MGTVFIQQDFSCIQSISWIGAQQAESFFKVVWYPCVSLSRAVSPGPLAQLLLAITSPLPLDENVSLAQRSGGGLQPAHAG